MIKALKVGEVIRKKTTCGPWLVIRIFEYGWQVVDLTSTDDPVIARIILPRNYEYWIRDIELPDSKILEKLEERLENEWNIL